ncbi:DMT family transporter [Sphingomonas corticis]|jgi:transporter family-2 protein|uniref:DMT family transporter n=1 Tax=Sphingomonas corticis TaxID=2722791 RepID=A0ABX1CIN4_9SPHN|nr:DMT family transporter [Sphingomonas corticis]NJR77229.1 DMT family transporter [Sphingomonas corticis]
MPQLLPILAVLIAGLGVAVQPPTNAALAKASGSVWLAALVSFAVGTLVLLVVWAVDRTPLSELKGAPWWAWFGGLYGAAFVAALAFATPRLGLAATLTMAIGAQVVTALLLDRFGWLGLQQQPISWGRLGGVALVLIGVLLVRRG